MQKYLFKNISVVNDEKILVKDVLISGGRIERVDNSIGFKGNINEINGEGRYLLPGAIDDQVHFREPGLTHKADIYTESRAAVAGGVTSFMDMPNTIPNALTMELLEEKYALAAQKSLANYSFYMGVSNTNADEALRANKMKKDICGLKIFMGSSTGNMLVDDFVTLNKVFEESEMLIATHCESEQVIKQNYESLKAAKPVLEAADHPAIRNEEACFESSFTAIQLAKKHNSRLHILHISTERELQLFTNLIPLKDKRITSEVCVHHLHFTSDDYADKGYLIKCNPAIKAPNNKEALWKALLDDRLDVIATDHAPHLLSEKEPPYEHAHSGLPLVNHSLPLMLYYYSIGKISLEKIVQKMSHAVADCFNIEERGYLHEGYFADMVVVNLNKGFEGNGSLYKCGWSPLQGFQFPATIEKTFINGHLVYENGLFNESNKGMRMSFKG